jgi:hypothetical protein
MKNFEEHFPAEAADHFYNDVYQVVRITVVLFREHGSLEGKIGSPKKNILGSIQGYSRKMTSLTR